MRKRGKPQQWSDQALRNVALNFRLENPDKKLSPFLLERETGVGRNVWSRRMKDYIEELNLPVSQEIIKLNSNELVFPSVQLILDYCAGDEIKLKNELFKLQSLFMQTYSKLIKAQEKERSYDALENQMQTLKQKLNNTLEQKKHYENLYLEIVATSAYPSNFNRSPLLKKHNITESLIDFENYKEKKGDFQNLHEHFPKEDNPGKNKNVSKLNSMFNLDLE